MKKITIIFILLSLASCKDDDGNNQNTSELKEIIVNIELPDNSNISDSDLTISSLFTENSDETIETFNENSMELTYASNNQGNLVLLSYFNPINGNEVLMNSETTAIALVMLHPWSFDLTPNAKQEASDYIKTLPEFQSFKETIESTIASGEINPLTTQEIFDKTTEIQNITFERLTTYIEPLEFDIENSTASIKNVVSSASYSIGLYDEDDVLIENKLAKGLEKSHFLFQEFQNNIFQESQSEEQTAVLEIPSNGEWTLKAKNGLSFDGSIENQQAAFYNTKNLAANVLGIFSTKLKEIVITNECMLALGEDIYNGVSNSISISQSLEEFSNNEISGYELTLKIISYLYNESDDVLNTIVACASENTDFYDLDKLKVGFFDRISGFIDILGQLGNVFDTTAMLTDWVQFDREIEYCFVKNNNEITECENPNTFIDPRDGQEYQTVLINDKIWFAQNLNYDANDSDCYDDNISNCNIYGKLYDWQTALNVCPDTWHLPSLDEYIELVNFLGGTAIAGAKLKSTDLWSNGNFANNESGFSGLPSGNKTYLSGQNQTTYFSLGDTTGWWTSTIYQSNLNQSFTLVVGNANSSAGINLSNNASIPTPENSSSGPYKNPCRCVKD